MTFFDFFLKVLTSLLSESIMETCQDVLMVPVPSKKHIFIDTSTLCYLLCRILKKIPVAPLKIIGALYLIVALAEGCFDAILISKFLFVHSLGQ